MWQRSASRLTSYLVAAALCAAGGAVTPSAAPQSVVDVLSYRISLEFGAADSAIRAVTEITCQVSGDGTERVRFDLVGLIVDSVKVAGANAAFGKGVGSLEVELGERAAPGDTVVVAVFYHGNPEDGLIFRRNAYGRPAVFADNWPDRARYWFPSVDHPRDKAMVEFRVRAPADWEVVASGRLVEEKLLDGDAKLTVWATEHPIPVYTMVFGAADLSVEELGALGCEVGSDRCVRITQWVYPEDEEQARVLFRRAPEIVAFFDSLIGPFPYEKLALVQSSTRYGGMENASAIFFGEGVVRRGRGDVVVAHEIAHQWFGDAVTEREWSHLWLAEGFATYFASVFYEFHGDETLARRLRDSAEARYLASPQDVARPVIDSLPANLMELLNANNYQKGAWVLQMLRQLLGDEMFFTGIRRYYAEYRHGTALTADLQRVMEEVSGRELDWYFDQWLRRPGYPQVETRHAWDAGEGTLELHVSQVQSWPAYRLPLTLEAAGAGFSLRRTFWVEGSDSRHQWSLPGEPRRVRVDPDNEILGPVTVVGALD
jgi:aminopeptidase N